MNKTYDVIAIGSCYVDTNLADYPFGDSGVPAEIELIGNDYETVPGGSAVNFCILLQKLGLKTAFVGMTGKDPNGDLLSQLLEKQGVKPALIRQPKLATNISFNMTNPNGKHIMLVAGNANAALNANTALPKLEVLIPQAHMLYLGGCFKLKSFISALSQVVEVAQQYACTLVVDHGRIPKNADEEMLNAIKELVLKADYYFPSHDEFCEIWSVSNIEDGLRLLQGQAPGLTTVVKDGTNGAYYFADGSVQHVPALKVEKVLNATGAGDSFNAGVIAALNAEKTLADAITYGCQVAAAKIKAEAPPLLR
jgi:sugar/nucleoside kinase (ribokinase family)